MSLVKIRADVTVNKIHVPLGIRMMVALRDLPRMKDAAKIILAIEKFITNGDTVMVRRLKKQLAKELSDPNGEFAKGLGNQLVHELQQQIDEQTKKVEIQIQ